MSRGQAAQGSASSHRKVALTSPARIQQNNQMGYISKAARKSEGDLAELIGDLCGEHLGSAIYDCLRGSPNPKSLPQLKD